MGLTRVKALTIIHPVHNRCHHMQWDHMHMQWDNTSSIQQMPSYAMGRKHPEMQWEVSLSVDTLDSEESFIL